MSKNVEYKSLLEKVSKHKFIDMVSVSDNWYPNFPGDKVEVHVSMFYRDYAFHIVHSYWGADDHSLSKLFKFSTYEEAVICYNDQIKWHQENVVTLQPIEGDYLLDFGFSGV